MASVYPGALDTFNTTSVDATVSATTHKNYHNDLADAINKIEAELGITPSAAFATVVARLADIEADIAALQASMALVLTASTGWAVTNETTDKVFDANATSLDELADVAGTLIEILKTKTVISS